MPNNKTGKPKRTGNRAQPFPEHTQNIQLSNLDLWCIKRPSGGWLQIVATINNEVEPENMALALEQAAAWFRQTAVYLRRQEYDRLHNVDQRQSEHTTP